AGGFKRSPSRITVTPHSMRGPCLSGAACEDLARRALPSPRLLRPGRLLRHGPRISGASPLRPGKHVESGDSDGLSVVTLCKIQNPRGDHAMRLGLFAMPLHHPARDTAAVIAEDREAVIVADRLGYDEAWIGEHFTSKAEPIVSPLMFLASLAPVTSKIRLGTGVVNLPHQHPAAVAAQAAFFDQLSGGRLMLGIGPGGLPSDAELFKDTDGAVRGRMMLESIEIIQAIWKGDPPYRFQGEFWDIDLKSVILPDYGVGVMPKPVQRPHPPIAIALRSPNSSTARLAGEKGWIPISANFIPSAHVATHWSLYAEGCEAAGRRPDPAGRRLARSILVTDSDEEAADRVADPEGG